METKTSDTVALYRKVAADDVPPYGLEKLADDTRLFSKPTLLCCGGLLVNDNRENNEKLANGFAKIGHALIGYNNTLAKDDPIDIVSVSYPHAESYLAQGLFAYTKAKMSGAEAQNTTFATEFARQQLFPLIEDEQGKPRDLATMKKNLRNVNILSHSYGGLFVQQVGNVLADHMKELGISDRDIRNATSQVVVVAAGPTKPLGADKASFTTIDVINSHDAELRKLYDMRDMIAEMLATSPVGKSLLVDEENKPVSRQQPRGWNERMRGSKDYFTKPLNIMPVSLKPDAQQPEFKITPDSNEHVVFYTPPIWLNGIQRIIERPTFNPYGVTDNVRAQEGSTSFQPKDENGHEPQVYFHYNLNKDGSLTEDGYTLRTLISSVLTNSISNSMENASRDKDSQVALPDVQQLMRLPEKVPYTMAEDVNFISGMRAKGYEKKLQQALLPPIQQGGAAI